MAEDPNETENPEPAPSASAPGAGKKRPGEWRDVLASDVINRYYGQHIAIVHKRVVAAGNSYEEVLRQAEEAYPTEMPYIAYIPVPKN